MYKIDSNNLFNTSAKQFCNQYYRENAKPVLFWDTCALLNIVRFIYREKPGDVTTYDSIKKIYDSIMNDTILSVSCISVITEFNEHVNEAISEMEKFISETYTCYKNIADVINRIDNSSIVHTDVTVSSLSLKLYAMAKEIMLKTKFITIDKTATANAHKRVLQHKAPAGKKEEFKDCTIWEVMLSCFRQLNTENVSMPKVFYTVNIHDFCLIVNKVPLAFLNDLVMESTALNFKCCKNVNEVVSSLGI